MTTAPDFLSWAEIRRLALKHRRALLLANGLAILATLCTVPIPLLLPLLVDEVLLGHAGGAIAFMNKWLPPELQLAVGYVGFMLLITFMLRILALVFNVLEAKLFVSVSKNVVYHLRIRLIDRLKRIALVEYESLGSGTVTAHLVTDLDTVDRFVGDTLSRLLIATLTLIGTASILVWMHWQLATLIFLFNPWVIYVTVRLGKSVKSLKKKENDSTAHFTQALTETLDAIQEIRANHRQSYYLGRLKECARNARDYAIASTWKSDAAGKASGLLFHFGIDVFRAAAMLTVLFSDLSVGQMLAVFSYLWFMISPIEQLLNLQYSYYGASGALSRLNELLSREDEPEYSACVNPFCDKETVSIAVHNLHFAYRQEPVLNGLTLNINAGEKVAIVGASGGGKSTLVQLLLGLYSAQCGRIYFGGIPLEQIGFACIREHVAVVLQHPALFNDSIRSNLSMGRNCNDNDCWNALTIAQLADTVRALPMQLDTIVGRSGVRLSGGQRQRLAIARMILANPKVVILDESTSALDTATECALHQAMDSFLRGRTTIIIAHRLSAVKQADKVLVFDGGRVAEQGTHASLIAENGLYARLYGVLQH